MSTLYLCQFNVVQSKKKTTACEHLITSCCVSAVLTCCLLCRCVEGSDCSYHHDRYSDRSAVVHLRLCQGLLPPAPPPSPWDARVSEEEAWPHRVNCPPTTPCLKPPSNPPRTSTAHKAVFYNSVISSARAQSCYYSCIFKKKRWTRRRSSCSGRPRVSEIFLCRNVHLILSLLSL